MNQEPLDPIDTELAALRERIAHLEASERQLLQELSRMERIVDKLPQSVYLFDVQRRENVYVNGDLITLLGHSADEIKQMGSSLLPSLMHPDDWASYQTYAAQFSQLRESEVIHIDYRIRDLTGAYRWVRSFERVFSRDACGAVEIILGLVQDLTEERHADAERAALREQMIVAQSAALREIGTPLIPISQGVVAMPLVGAIDDDRAARILEVLLDGITERRAQVAILDVTGVKEMGERTAAALCKAARAGSLLGAKVILTGVQPEMARILVALGVNTSDFTTRATLQEAITHALDHRAR
ncbi:STAS domain-containing protein [Chondromyces crocatus]|uniref:Anti-anti-sigma factor n=1 Tax=Chondromyces crocatus TaxID=52 RepID=A0A0K1EM48_CHOCO|nr:STAS domain-containing protein [Chondromyces crocatus]AKT41722.1 uncharacterized protein CMC5_059330 [Chondromyces crocatus]